MDYCLEYELLNDENHIYKSVSFDELMDLINSLGTGIVYIGGPWCLNCQAIIDLLNNVCKKEKLECIYNFDPRFVNIYGEVEDFRDCSTLEIKLKYYELVEKIGYKSDELVIDTLIPRIKVPFIFAIRNGVCVGYYSDELLRDGVLLHKKGEDLDLTIDFAHEILTLIKKIEENTRLI